MIELILAAIRRITLTMALLCGMSMSVMAVLGVHAARGGNTLLAAVLGVGAAVTAVYTFRFGYAAHHSRPVSPRR